MGEIDVMHAWRIAGAVAAKIFRMLACLVAAYLIYAMAILIPGSSSAVERVEDTAAACSVGLSYLFRMKDGVKRLGSRRWSTVAVTLFRG